MKIAISSDIHDNVTNLEKALEEIKKLDIKQIIFCGDFCAPSTLKVMASEFSGVIHAVFGNVDGDKYLMMKFAYEEFKNIKFYGDLGEITLDNKKIAFIHSHTLAEALAYQDKYDIVFYGHTHTKDKRKIKNTFLVNPGSIQGTKEKPSFTIYDTEKGDIEFKEVE